MDKPKLINLSCDYKGYVPFTFENEFYNQLDNIWDNNEFKKLAE